MMKIWSTTALGVVGFLLSTACGCGANSAGVAEEGASQVVEQANEPETADPMPSAGDIGQVIAEAESPLEPARPTTAPVAPARETSTVVDNQPDRKTSADQNRAASLPPPGATASADVWLKVSGKRDTSIREKLGETDLAPHWIYDDLHAARAVALETGKPLLVLFRCVPCQCAAVLDEQVARRDSDSESLQQKFVCVRVVQMNGVNLEVFQFDRDLSFAVLFMNPDGTVYGRYGTRATLDRRSMSHISHASFQKAMERSLVLHTLYPANRQQLQGKQSAAVDIQFPEDMPHMRSFGFPAETRDCIHCHMVGEARLETLNTRGQLTQNDVWPYPLPENIGLKLDNDDGLLVKTVQADSPAAAAGLKMGDRLLSLGGQPLVSQSDVQWVLHHVPAQTALQVEFQRNGETQQARIALAGDWKKADTSWRASLAGIRPNVEFRVNSFKHQQGIGANAMGLTATYPRGAAAKAGLRSGDLVVAVDGRTDLMTEADFLHYIHFSQPRPTSVRLVVLRKGERLELTVPLE